MHKEQKKEARIQEFLAFLEPKAYARIILYPGFYDRFFTGFLSLQINTRIVSHIRP
jgi:hypothetical protein